MQRVILLLALVAIVAAGCGGDDGDEGSAAGDELTVQLSEQNGSGESGTATFTAEGAMTRVVIDISNGPSTAQPAHIHEGSCADLNPQPAYALESVVDGKSTSTVSATLEALKGKAYAVNVHKSDADLQTYVACGDVGGSGGDDGSGGIGY